MATQFTPLLRKMLLTGTALIGCTTTLTALAQSAPEEVVEAAPESLVQETIVIRGLFIPDEKRETSEISSLLDAEDFKIQGDSDAASALSRSAGVSVSKGKFVVVRGLNERYSNATINGSPLPSPEPLRRVAPLDLFPTSALRSALVQKTYSPEFSGEFGGGVVDIRTKTIPDAGFFEIGGSTSANSTTSFQDGLLHGGGNLDWLGIDDGTRDLPSQLADVYTSESFVDINSADRTRSRAAGLQLVENPELYVQQEGIVGPDFDLSASGGSRFDINNDFSVGFLGSVSYDNSWSTRDGVVGFLIDDPSVADSEARNRGEGTRRRTQNKLGLNGLGVLGFELFQDHEVQFVGFATRSTDKETKTTTAQDIGTESFFRTDDFSFVERELWVTQALGQSYFPSLLELEVDWRASYSEANRDAPFEFSTNYGIRDVGDTIIETGQTDNTVNFSNILDDSTDIGVDFKLPLSLFEREFFIKAGYAYTEKDRESFSREYILDIQNRGVNDVDLRDNTRIDTFYNAALGLNGWGGLSELDSFELPQSYLATLESDAFYAGIDWQIADFIRIAIGGRYEDAIEALDSQRVLPTTSSNAEDCNDSAVTNCVEAVINSEDWMPAATLTWQFADDFQLRGAYSETIIRPQFRELGPTIFIDNETGDSLFGNPYLKNTNLKNYDLRAEYYFGREQFLTFGTFYKEIENPIEEYFSGGETVRVSYLNAPAAHLRGLELEYQQVIPVSEWLGGQWFASKEFEIRTNYTYSNSSVAANGGTKIFSLGTGLLLDDDTDGDGINDGTYAFRVIRAGRQMTGQSEHLANFQIGFTDLDANSQANLLVNFASERIRTPENVRDNIPAVIEQLPVTLDFVYYRDFEFVGGNYQFGLKFKNILDDNYEAFQNGSEGRVDFDTYDVGRSISVSLKHVF